MTSKLPEQIQRQINAAQAIVDAQRQAAGAPAATEGTPAPEAAEKPAAETVAPVAAQGTSAEDENSPTYAQRWRSLQGTWQAERQRNEALQQQMAQLQQQLTQLQTAPLAAKAAAAPFITEQDAADYGADMIEMVRRAAREEVRDVAGAVVHLQQDLDGVRQVVPAVQRVAQDVQLSAQERFFRELAAAVPDFEQVNANQQFKDWLMTPDPMTGILRQTYLADAQRNGDATRVANIFTAWKSLSGTQGQTQARADETRRLLERQQAPSRGVAEEPKAEQGRIWDPSDITRLFEEKRQGKWAGREQEFKALEQDIFKAQREGRIQRRAA